MRVTTFNLGKGRRIYSLGKRSIGIHPGTLYVKFL